MGSHDSFHPKISHGTRLQYHLQWALCLPYDHSIHGWKDDAEESEVT